MTLSNTIAARETRVRRALDKWAFSLRRGDPRHRLCRSDFYMVVCGDLCFQLGTLDGIEAFVAEWAPDVYVGWRAING